MSILVFIIILSFLVIIHELGHFLFARKFGIKVEEFGLGYPPKAKVLKTDKHGTEYTLNWLPFGGFVRMYGEDGVGEKQAGAFFQKSVKVRLIVVAAGAVINFIFGALAFGVIYTWVGIPTQYPYVKIDEVAVGSPAETAGIMPGEMYEAVVVDGEEIKVGSVEEFVSIIPKYRGKTVELKEVDTSELVPVYIRNEVEVPEGEGAIGVVVTDFEMKHYPIWQMPFRGGAYGVKTALEFGVMLLQALAQMVGKLFQGEVPADVAGPVGIAYMAQKEGILSGGFLSILNFAAILSINLSIVNLLPIPALDGGRAAFLIFEGIFKKKVNANIEQKINTVGFLALVSLLILISVKDIGMVAGDKGIQDWVMSLFKQ